MASAGKGLRRDFIGHVMLLQGKAACFFAALRRWSGCAALRAQPHMLSRGLQAFVPQFAERAVARAHTPL
jgi:hypothetical protein